MVRSEAPAGTRLWHRWFAWRPVRCKNGLFGIVWLSFVWRKCDDRGRWSYQCDPETEEEWLSRQW